MSIIVNYTTSKDESFLDPPQYIQLEKIYNLILIPDSNFNITPSDIVLINNKPHKAALASGTIDMNKQTYKYFYIAPGFKYQYGSKFNIKLYNNTYNLDTTFSSKYSAKILYGLLVLPNNLLYLFKNQKSVMISDGSKTYETVIKNVYNKYNYYMSQKNNTIIDILDSNNIETIKLINQEFQNSVFIRPLYNSNFPLGSITFDIKGVNSHCGLSIESDHYNKKLLIDPTKIFTIDNLSFGNYKISLFTQDTTLYFTNITIDKIHHVQNPNNSSIPNFFHKKQPLKNKANLLINLPHHKSFEIKGPNNFYFKFISGYQYLQNIEEGYYTIIGSDFEKSLYVIKNDNNYLS